LVGKNVSIIFLSNAILVLERNIIWLAYEWGNSF